MLTKIRFNNSAKNINFTAINWQCIYELLLTSVNSVMNTSKHWCYIKPYGVMNKYGTGILNGARKTRYATVNISLHHIQYKINKKLLGINTSYHWILSTSVISTCDGFAYQQVSLLSECSQAVQSGNCWYFGIKRINIDHIFPILLQILCFDEVGFIKLSLYDNTLLISLLLLVSECLSCIRKSCYWAPWTPRSLRSSTY